MSDSIRIIASSAHCDTVAVYDHQVIVKRVPGGFNCECSIVSEIGNVPCNQSGICWHTRAAIKHLVSTHTLWQVDWYDSEDESYWEWACKLLTSRWTVSSPTGKAWVVAAEAERTVTLVLQ